MSNLVRKNTLHPKNSLYHHSIIKLLILNQLKERNHTWDTFIFKVLNPHLNICKCRRYSHRQESRPYPSTRKKNPNIVHLDDDVSEAIPYTWSYPVVPTEFIRLSQPFTRKRKVEFAQTSHQPHVQPLVQSSIQPNIQRDHLDSPVKTHIPDPDFPLYALANLSVDLLNDTTH